MCIYIYTYIYIFIYGCGNLLDYLEIHVIVKGDFLEHVFSLTTRPYVCMYVCQLLNFTALLYI